MRLHHLSAAYLGQQPILTPRIPRDRLPFENATVRRVCVAPTLRGCLLALQDTYYAHRYWFHYSIELPMSEIYPPIAVPDASLTGEQWLLERLVFHYEGYTPHRLLSSSGEFAT